MMALLTPIVKAFITDNGFAARRECLQVFGGHGYIREWGMEQYVRDARINMIYEGTNTIQSLDLLGRKVLMDNGAKLRKFGEMVKAFVEENGTATEMAEFITPLADLGDKVDQADDGNRHEGDRATRTRPAPPPSTTCAWSATWCFGYFWARMAQGRAGEARPTATRSTRSTRAKLATARFYFAAPAARDRDADPLRHARGRRT